jgi:hypothetical protein
MLQILIAEDLIVISIEDRNLVENQWAVHKVNTPTWYRYQGM